MEDFGGRLASVWSELRPTTRGLVERALQTPSAPPAPARHPNAPNAPYDARADHELSRLLAALDERALESDASLEAEKETQLRHIADTCAAVLQEKTRSAEVFAQLVRRADSQRNYARIDALADALMGFAPSEICELARSLADCIPPRKRALVTVARGNYGLYLAQILHLCAPGRGTISAPERLEIQQIPAHDKALRR